MERHFGLPIAFAAAAHAALLFGFSKPARVAPEPEKKTVTEWLLSPPPVDPPELVATESKSSAPLERPEPAPIRQPEPPTIDVPTIFTQPKPPPTPFDPNSISRIAPVHLANDGHGIADRVGPLVPSSSLDNPPRTRYQAAPLYPFEAKHTGASGEVVVEFIVDESGRVQDPHVVGTSDRVFEESALRAVGKWVFEPGKRGGKTVRFRMSVPIVFKLNE